MDAPFSLSLSSPLGTTHPAQCSEKAKPTREDLGVTLYSGSHRCFERDFLFFSLSLRMETSRHFFHHGLIQCLLTRTSHFPLIRRYFACTPAYNFPSNLSLLPLNVECSSNDPARRWRCVSSRISIFALYSVVGIERSKKFSKSVSSTFISYIRVCIYIYIYICVRELMRVGGKKNVNKRARSPCQSIFALSCKQDKGSKLRFVYTLVSLLSYGHTLQLVRIARVEKHG